MISTVLMLCMNVWRRLYIQLVWTTKDTGGKPLTQRTQRIVYPRSFLKDMAGTGTALQIKQTFVSFVSSLCPLWSRLFCHSKIDQFPYCGYKILPSGPLGSCSILRKNQAYCVAGFGKSSLPSSFSSTIIFSLL